MAQEQSETVRVNSNMAPLLIHLDATGMDRIRETVLRGVIRRMTFAGDIFPEIHPSNPPAIGRERMQADFGLPYDILQAWSIRASRRDISDRLMRQPISSINRFPSRVNGNPDLARGITVDFGGPGPQQPPPSGPQQPLSSDTNTLLPNRGPVSQQPQPSGPQQPPPSGPTSGPQQPPPQSRPSFSDLALGLSQFDTEFGATPLAPTAISPASTISSPPLPHGQGLAPALPSQSMSSSLQQPAPTRRSSFPHQIDLISDEERGDEDVPYDTIVDSMGRRSGRRQVRFPDTCDTLDFPQNVVYSLRLGENSLLWFPSDDICSVCRETSTTENPCYYTPCAHRFHRSCWENVAAVAVNHPHEQRLDGQFRVPPVTEANPCPQTPLDRTLTLCPNCRTYVGNDSLGTHATSLVVPYESSHLFPDNYHMPLIWSRTGIQISFRNREVLPQPERSSEASGGHSNHCGALAAFNLGRYLNGESLLGPEAVLDLERELTNWKRLHEDGILSTSTNMEGSDIYEYIAQSSFPNVLDSTFQTWCPTDPHGRSIRSALNDSILDRRRLPLIVNNGNHWFVISLEWPRDDCAELVFMEPMDPATSTSLSILLRNFLPQLLEGIDSLVSGPQTDDRNNSNSLISSTQQVSLESLDEMREIRRLQDLEYAESLERDQQHEDRDSENASQEPRPLVPVGGNIETDDASPSPLSPPTTRVDPYWSRVHRNRLREGDVLPRRQRRPNPRYGSAHSDEDDD